LRFRELAGDLALGDGEAHRGEYGSCRRCGDGLRRGEVLRRCPRPGDSDAARALVGVTVRGLWAGPSRRLLAQLWVGIFLWSTVIPRCENFFSAARPRAFGCGWSAYMSSESLRSASRVGVVAHMKTPIQFNGMQALVQPHGYWTPGSYNLSL